MMRKVVVAIVALLLLPCSAIAAQKTYKWIDSQGNVSYHDRPPPENAGYRVEERQMGSKHESVSDESSDAAQKFPVVLYAVPKCPSCDAARAYLQKRKVPFAERNVESDVKLQQELKAKVGNVSVPTIVVGQKVMNGYVESLLEGELDQAGYPKTEATGPVEKPAEETGFKAPTQ